MRVDPICEEPRSKLGHYNEKKVHSHVLGYQSTWCSNTCVLKTIYICIGCIPSRIQNYGT